MTLPVGLNMLVTIGKEGETAMRDWVTTSEGELGEEA